MYEIVSEQIKIFILHTGNSQIINQVFLLKLERENQVISKVN